MASVDINIDSTWQSVNALTGYANGTKLSIHNKTNDWLYLAENGQPVEGSKEGYILAPFHHTEASYVIVTEGSPEVWIRSLRWPANVFVQEI